MMYCDCSACELSKNCPVKNQYRRLPPEYYPGAKGMCLKLKIAEQRFIDEEKHRRRTYENR